MTCLSLVVYGVCFNAIVQGDKKIEYRAASDYWISRLTVDLPGCPPHQVRQFDEVEFRVGYQKKGRRAVFKCDGIEWIGPKFEIHIGARLR